MYSLSAEWLSVISMSISSLHSAFFFLCFPWKGSFAELARTGVLWACELFLLLVGMELYDRLTQRTFVAAILGFFLSYLFVFNVEIRMCVCVWSRETVCTTRTCDSSIEFSSTDCISSPSTVSFKGFARKRLDQNIASRCYDNIHFLSYGQWYEKGEENNDNNIYSLKGQ